MTELTKFFLKYNKPTSPPNRTSTNRVNLITNPKLVLSTELPNLWMALSVEEKKEIEKIAQELAKVIGIYEVSSGIDPLIQSIETGKIAGTYQDDSIVI